MLFFVYLIFLVMPSAISAVQFSNRWHLHSANASDREVMLGFLSAITTNDPSQSLPTNWHPNVSVCEWTGIICNQRTERVLSLNLMGMGLKGTISPLLGNLSFLTILDLSNNSFHGHVPYQLGSLLRLKMLLLSLNQLEGSIPPTLAGCRSLRNFSMSANNLTGNIPSQLCALPNLQYIHLGSNNLMGTIPACLGNISSLDYINLNSNNLHGRVPSELGLLSLVGVINMWNNSLTGQIPSSFSNCTSLRQLALADNRLTGHIPANLCSKNTQLAELYLFGNWLSGSVPPSLFNCTELQVIEFGRNQLSGVVPMELGKLTQLQHLYLHNNQLVSGSTTPILTALTNCSSLQTIALSGNNLTGRLPFSIGQLSIKMDAIYLGNNEFAGEIPLGIGNLTSLTLLESEANFLTGAIPPLNGLLKLERIYLGSNNLEGNIPTEIGQLTSLGLLDLRGNKLSGRIPDSLSSLQQLRYLDLSQNQLSGSICANLAKCVKLELLDLSYNSLTGRIPPQVAELANLAFYFNLSNNLLNGPVPLELSKMAEVQAIDISANWLTGDIPTLESCKALEYLNLSHNALEGLIPDSLGKLQNLQDIDFSSNKLSGGIPMLLENFSHLNFSFNNLSGEVPEVGVFKKLGATAFMGNVGLCGEWVNLPPCSSGKHNRRWLLERVITPVVAVTAIVLWCLFLGIVCRQNRRRPAMFSLELNQLLRVSHGELMIATDEFSEANLVGVGSFGKVYKGVLAGEIIAVKRFTLENEGANKSFDKERKVLSKVRHRNLIRMITSYSGPEFRALIFPLMPNGSLEKWLYPNGEEECGLSLIQRLNIAIDIAQGMTYLHHHCVVQVIHCDLKPNNVLLDEELTAYLADFGISTMCSANSEGTSFTSTQLKGSIGYIPPEYALGGPVTTKGDVYSYGIVLLEMITRKKPTHDMFVEGMNLQNWVSSSLQNQNWDVMDRNLLRRTSSISTPEEDEELKCLIQLLSVGLLCTKDSLHERPSMMEIVFILQIIKGNFVKVITTTNSEADVSIQLDSSSTTSNNSSQSQSSSTSELSDVKEQ